MYNMREEIKAELTKFGRGKTVKEMSDREVQEFFEYVHQTYEVGLEEKVHALGSIRPDQYELFSKFVKVIAAQPDFFHNIPQIIQQGLGMM